jgi:hypothetical protein
MNQYSPVTDRRQQVRVRVDLPGVAEFPTTKVSLRVVDLSLGGARVELPMHVSLYQLQDIQSLTIAANLYAKVAWRWSRDREAGLEFLAPALSKASILALIGQSAP